MSSTDRSLVLGAYTGLPPRHLQPFVSSLRATEFKGSLGIVCGGYGADERRELSALADVVIDVGHEYSSELRVTRQLLAYLRRTRGLRRAYPTVFQAVARAGPERESFRRWSSLEYRLEGLQALRYLHYHRWIREREPAPDCVMITDLRDVFFQRDPFADPVRDLEVYLEDASVSIGADDFNTRWIRDLFGAKELEALRGRPISCSGTVVGTREGMLAYLAEMAMQIVWRRQPIGAHDQAVHNLLVHRGLLPSAAVIPNGRGRVLTMGKMSSYRTGADGTIQNLDGSIPAVLHQWDRHEPLVARVARRAIQPILSDSV